MDDGIHPQEVSASRPPYRVDATLLAHDWPIQLLLAADLIFGLVVWPRMPARVPTHFGINGTPNGWGPSWINAILLPAVAIGFYFLMLALPLADPRRANYARFPETLRVFRFALTGLFVAIHVVLVRASFGAVVNSSEYMLLAVALLFIVLGNSMGRVRFNYFFGVRTPWTLNDEENWNATHRLTARLWVVCGLALLPAAFLPGSAGTIASIAIAATAALLPIVYSYVFYRRRNRRQ
jgi:uncharacterized membrane protein